MTTEMLSFSECLNQFRQIAATTKELQFQASSNQKYSTNYQTVVQWTTLAYQWWLIATTLESFDGAAVEKRSSSSSSVNKLAARLLGTGFWPGFGTSGAVSLDVLCSRWFVCEDETSTSATDELAWVKPLSRFGVFAAESSGLDGIACTQTNIFTAPQLFTSYSNSYSSDSSRTQTNTISATVEAVLS